MDEDRRVRGRHLFDVSQNGFDALALADELLEIVLMLDLFLKIEVLVLEAVLQPLDFHEDLGILDRNGRFMSEDSRSCEFLFAQRPTTKLSHDTEQLSAEFQRVAAKRAERFVFHSLFIRESVVAEHVVRVDRSEALGDFSDLERFQRNLAIFTIDISKEPGARLKVQAAIPIRTICGF